MKLSQIPLESINLFVRMFPVCGDVEKESKEEEEGRTMKEETERDSSCKMFSQDATRILITYGRARWISIEIETNRFVGRQDWPPLGAGGCFLSRKTDSFQMKSGRKITV